MTTQVTSPDDAPQVLADVVVVDAAETIAITDPDVQPETLEDG